MESIFILDFIFFQINLLSLQNSKLSINNIFKEAVVQFLVLF
jgi:hypothetical protein